MAGGRHTHQQPLYAGTTPLDTIPADMVERIEVLDGGQASFYGTQAVAGAVNVVTKAFADQPSGSFSFGGDTDGGKQLSGNFRDALGKDRFVIYASHNRMPTPPRGCVTTSGAGNGRVGYGN